MEYTDNHQFESKKVLPTLGERQEEAKKFIASLSRQPEKWRVSGSTSRGNFRAASDLDIDALYQKDDEIPVDEIMERMDPDNGLIDGYIDFHYFARDWLVFRQDSKLLIRKN